ncbi:MAG: hypothetical protein KGI51_16105, partial [Rhodospirillales bacterium]|nr:hypothetical protein [Rhodospirillales bacterium]
MPARRPVPPPDEASLREAALAHLARYAATEARLGQVLTRRLERWARQEAGQETPEAIAARLAALRPAIARIVAALARAGAVD